MTTFFLCGLMAAASCAPIPALVPLVQDPFTSVEDAEDRLAQIEDVLRGAQDRRAVFATMYRITTRATVERLGGDFFLDPEWTGELTFRFADYYRDALLAYEEGRWEDVPEAWRIAFSACDSGRFSALPEALLGMNAPVHARPRNGTNGPRPGPGRRCQTLELASRVWTEG